MILTITPNSALDRVLFIDEFRPGITNRASKTIDCIGGKGLDASVVLRALGAETLGMTFAAGARGRRLVALLDTYGIAHDVVWVDGETRIAHVLVETSRHRHTHITTSGLSISPAAQDEFLRRYRSHVGQADWVIAAGSLPDTLPTGFYQTLAVIAQEVAVPILIDCPGAPTRAAFSAHPAIVKMNRAEFAATFGSAPAAIAALKKEAETVAKREHLAAFVLTCGAEGILAVTEKGAWLASSPLQQEVNAAGAGDAVSAALVWQLTVGDGWPEALRWAAATSAAVVLTEGTADCHKADVTRILAETSVQSL
ncbi:MAG: hexose kinase [Anaerolineae bacterium]|nr:hexose kinase [Anaerolineae bacterium]